jgi:hypothetical protein
MRLQRTERTLAGAAAKAGMDEKTARKYRRLRRAPSEGKKQRTWQTRVNVFQEVSSYRMEAAAQKKELAAAVSAD